MVSLCASVRAQEPPKHLPNPNLTPGDAFAVSRDAVCAADYSNPASKIPVDLKSRVFHRYGVRGNAVGYNVDHLIPTDLGGSNSLKNLWPQQLSGEWNYQMKNRLESRLKKMVCRGEVALETARTEIASDWVAAYKRYIAEPRKRSRSGQR
jgi:hypothetical protein